MTLRRLLWAWLAIAGLQTVAAIGTLFKIQGWPLMSIPNTLQWVITVLIIAKLLRHPSLKDLLDS